MWWTSTTGGIIPSLMILIAVIVVFRSLKKDMGDNARWKLILHVEDQNSFFLQQTRVQDYARDQHLLPRLGPPHHLPHDPLTVQQTDNLHVGLSN